MGIEAYLEEQRKKKALLARMLEEYDDGFHDVFFCLAANMLEMSDLEAALEEAGRESGSLCAREKALRLQNLLQACAALRGIPLVLRG